MKSYLTGAALLAALLATACGGGPGDQIASACLEGGEMSEAACTCLGDRADSELTDEQQTTLVALMEEEEDSITEPTAAQMEVALFLMGAALECQAQN